MASCSAVRSSFLILSNSSIQAMPLSASTTVPASSIIMPVLSLTTAAVKPAAVEPLPDAYKPRGASLEAYFNNSLLAVPGSPMNRIFMSPRTELPPSVVLFGDPISISKTASFCRSSPLMFGATD